MLTHVVMFNLREGADVASAAQALRGLEGEVPTLREIEVGVDVLPSDRSAHLVLITRFDDPEGLQAYQVHPAHQAVVQQLRRVATRSIKVDYLA